MILLLDDGTDNAVLECREDEDEDEEPDEERMNVMRCIMTMTHKMVTTM